MILETTLGRFECQISGSEISAIFQLFEQQATRLSDAIAITFEQTHLTYEELNNRANQLAHYLRSVGVGTETRVGIYVERSLEMVIGLLGILKAGGAYIPLDPAYPADRLAFMLEDAQISVLLTQAALLARLADYPAQAICLDTDWQTIAPYPTCNPENPIDADQLAYVIYTSGSTGKPKGVQIQHGSVINFLGSMSQQPGISPADVLLAVTTLSFDIAVLELFLPLSVGAHVVIASREVACDGIQLAALLSTSGATLMQATPASWRMLLKAGWLGNLQLKILCGGEALPRELAHQLLQRSASVWNLYGPTETTVWSTIYQVEPGTGSIPIGQPIANTQLYLLDSKLQPVAPGEMGELHIGGAGLARGYLNRSELTDERFIPNPFAEQDKWSISQGETILCPSDARLYKTGDLARLLPDGNLEYLGRIDHQVKVRGFRIELGEIEATLWQHPAIHEVVVVAREDIPGDQRLVAYVALQAEQNESLALQQTLSATLRRFLQQSLPDYMLPAHFVFLAALPLTPNGKIDRRALPTPHYTRSTTDRFVAPRTPVEQQLSVIWTEVLGIAPISVDDQFLDLGGHSLLATQIISRIRNVLHVELPLRCLFEAATIAGLAERIAVADRHPIIQLDVTQPCLKSVQRGESIPLSFMQEQLWFLDQLVPDHPFYNVPEAVRLEGKLEVKLLEQCLQTIVHRHEALRTTFTVQDGSPVQVIHSASDAHCYMQIALIDLQDLSVEEQEQQAVQQLTEAAQRSFDLAQDLLIRATLIRLSDCQHILLLNLHHIICDEWSFSILWQELATLYTALLQGQSALLPAPALQYPDFAVWQRQSQPSPSQLTLLEQQIAYWKQQLNGLSVLQLPTDYSRSPLPTYEGARHCFSLPHSLSERLKVLSRQEGATLFMTLLAAFQTLLFRYTAEADLAVGSPIANRHRSEVEGTIGFFVNTLVLRTDLSGSPSFRELLRRVRHVALDAYAHQDLPFEQLVQTLQPDRVLNQNPLFQVMFNLQNIPVSGSEIPNLSLTRLSVDNKTAKFDLFLELTETATGLAGYFEYSTDLFKAETIVRMVEHFQILLEGITANPDQALTALPLLTSSEQQQIEQWNTTATNYSQQCAHQLFEAQVERTPDAIALVFANQQLTYRELNHRANQVAHYLQSLGVSPDVAVGLCIERSLDLMVGLLGILKAGGAYVPLDPTYPPERLAFMLENAQAAVLLTQSSLVNLVDSLPEPGIQPVCLDTDWGTIVRYSPTNPDCRITPDHLAYIIYTSGSTGKPKGVAMPHRPLTNLLSWQIHHSALSEHLSSSARTLQFAPVSFDVSFQESFATLASGGTLVLISEETRRDAVQLLHFLQDAAIERLFLPFVALQHLAEVAEVENVVPTCLREVITAGEQLRITPPIVNWFSQLQNCTLHNHYGPSESHVVTALTLTGSPQTWAALPPIGRPIANAQIHLLDAQLQPVPIGVAGELYIGGVSLARGYLNRSDLTAERFIANPFAAERKWMIRNGKPVFAPSHTRLYKTGDLARYLPDGNIEYLGRIDQQVKIRGFRIEPGEVAAVLEQHPAIREAVVIAREDVPGRKRLVGYLIATQDATAQEMSLSETGCTGCSASVIMPSNAELRQFSQAHLPDYMVPTAFVVLDALPLTPSGKVDRRSLPLPDDTRTDLTQSIVLPRTGVEQTLAKIWAQVLQVESIGVHDNFFELGGHSLLGTQLVMKVRAAFAIELTLRQFFEAPTLAELAQIVEAAQQPIASQSSPAPVRINLMAEARLDPAIHPQGLSYTPIDQPAAIFLTGATGFLGAYLLHELLQQTQADIYCLIRAKDAEQGGQRLQRNLEQYGLWHDASRSRLIPVIGDLAKSGFGLSPQQFQALAHTIDVIYHNGGLVNFLYPYSVLKAPNVLGSQEVLRLASQSKIKPVHFVSTVGVFAPADYTDTPVIREQDHPNRTASLYGYTQSKWAAEQLMIAARTRGIPTCIYRPYWIEGHSQTGVCNGTDFLRSLIKGCIQLGTVPDWQMRVDMLPVDYLSQAIVHLSRQSDSLNQSFHFSNANSLSWSELVDWLRQFGYSLQQLPYETWIAEVINLDTQTSTNALSPFIPYFSDKLTAPQLSVPELYFHAKPLHFDCQNVLNGLANSAIVCPAVDSQLLHTYFAYFIRSNFLSPPPQAKNPLTLKVGVAE